ncbi:MAG: OmpH family outer membrane protein [Rhodothermaceae bacterium]|nr:OmpH family outer membrane protein [Rhodothermaceae bacterium]MYF39884.1 OmpH family outer membrane protein [Rhodothermaceae bacterium]
MKKFFGLGVVFILMSSPALAQHKIAYIDSDRIYQNYPEFTTAQQSLDRLAQQWEQDLAERQAALDEMFEEYQARELLYTSESRQEKQNEIIAAEEELERMRMQYFGPEGQLFHQQEQILRPIQERVLTVIQEVAEGEGYDYVFDRNGDFVFLYANESLNITDLVLEELGVDITRIIGQ